MWGGSQANNDFRIQRWGRGGYQKVLFITKTGEKGYLEDPTFV